MFGLFCTTSCFTYQQVTACNIGQFNRFFHGMLERGVYLAPSAYEAGFVSDAHTIEDIDNTVAIAYDVFGTLK